MLTEVGGRRGGSRATSATVGVGFVEEEEVEDGEDLGVQRLLLLVGDLDEDDLLLR